MMEDWLANICGILRASDIHQIYGDLIRFETKWNDEKGEFEAVNMTGKCALGVISCEVGMTLDYDHQLHDYVQILQHASVPDELIDGSILPYLDVHEKRMTDDVSSRYIGEFDIIYDESGGSILSNFSEYIFKMNDGSLTFKEIADFLEETFGDYNNVGEGIQ